MLVAYVRSSSYNNYEFCEMQYFITYVLGWKSDSGKKAELGTMIHKVMELLSSLKKFQQDKPKVKWLKISDDVVGAVRVPKDSLLTKDCVEQLADMSFAAYKSISKNRWGAGDRRAMSEVMWLMLDHNEGQFDPRYRHIHETEPHFDIPIEEEWAKLDFVDANGKTVKGQLAIKGTIDLVTLLDKDTIEVIDWKTGRRLNWATMEEKDYEKLKDDPQLLLYFYAMSKLYPDYPNRIMSIFFCKDPEGKIDPKPFSMCFDESDEVRFLGMLKKRVEQIRENITPKPLDSKRKHFKCKSLCHFCKNKWKDSDDNMCIYIEKQLKEHGMQETISKCTRPGFQIGFYEAPG